MIKTNHFEANGYYVFESCSSSRSCYFESKEEIRIFRVLLYRYLHKYVKIHKIFLSSEGYHVLIKVRGKEVLKKHYKLRCEKKGLKVRLEFLNEVWRIVSDQVRIFHSVYAKWINKNRNRMGVLVQCKYKKYYFSSLDYFNSYIKDMEAGKDVISQRNIKYSVSKRWKNLVNWLEIRQLKFVNSLMNRAFHNFVVEEVIKSTFASHHPPP